MPASFITNNLMLSLSLMLMIELNQLEEQIVAALKAERKDVKEVQVRFEVVSEKGRE